MRLDGLSRLASRRRLDQVLVMNQGNIRALAGVNCDNAVLALSRRPRTGDWSAALYTDFRYVPMVHRVAPKLACRDLKRLRASGARIGYEPSIPHSRFLALAKQAPRAKFVDVSKDIAELRAVKTPDEIERLRAAEKLACDIWLKASSRCKAGMTERDMARIFQKMAIERGEGEAFPTIVCVGRNAAECHHEPDDTVWNGRECVLVDMGVKLGGVCSDLTRNLVVRPSRLYRKVYSIVREANRAAIAAARPGMTGRALDKVARGIIAKAGFGRCFGHSLGHGVGYEIHEAPMASRRGEMVLKPGMLVTVEPGIYLEGNLGVRIEDLILITDDGCEVLSADAGV
ncbi:MAG: aminopeptidase P family protein [Kiritimatiellae bacterium]|nr:aminopeptidase P family protein [Kiritimatiellia bacterium]